MPDFFEVLMNRRSIRNYKDDPVSEEQLEKILEAVRWSPSWANTQVWEIVAVRNQTVKEELQTALAKGNPATKAIVTAPVVLAVCGKLNSSGYYKGEVTTKLGDWFMYDLGIATQSICLAAQALGLGTVVVGLFDQDKAAGTLNLPEGYEVVSLIPLGYPGKESPAPKRREIKEFTHYDKF